jgi:hypothetical protein
VAVLVFFNALEMVSDMKSKELFLCGRFLFLKFYGEEEKRRNNLAVVLPCGRLLFLTDITEKHRNNDLTFGLSC